MSTSEDLEEGANRASTEEDATVIARTVGRIVVPIILVTAIALLLQGHNLPGGGFIGGVLTASAFALIYIVYDMDYLDTEVLHRTSEPDLWPPLLRYFEPAFALGLALAAGSGIVAMAFDVPFLTQTFWVFHHLPLYGELHVASALAFDVGVYFVVVGALLTILTVVGAE
ncbi:MAG: multicomponent Na+:H+ antiporter subunit B [Halobacteriales archaeon]